MSPEQIAKNARKTISRYCLTECPAYCCRKGNISLRAGEMLLLAGTKMDDLISRKVLIKLGEDSYSLRFTYDEACPKLKDNRCTIHSNPNRPLVCRNYPLFIIGKRVQLSPSCFAVRTSILYPYIHKFQEKGYQVVI